MKRSYKRKLDVSLIVRLSVPNNTSNRCKMSTPLTPNLFNSLSGPGVIVNHLNPKSESLRWLVFIGYISD